MCLRSKRLQQDTKTRYSDAYLTLKSDPKNIKSHFLSTLGLCTLCATISGRFLYIIHPRISLGGFLQLGFAMVEISSIWTGERMAYYAPCLNLRRSLRRCATCRAQRPPLRLHSGELGVARGEQNRWTNQPRCSYGFPAREAFHLSSERNLRVLLAGTWVELAS